jgi:anti-anti-sigma regulatory factor
MGTATAHSARGHAYLAYDAPAAFEAAAHDFLAAGAAAGERLLYVADAAPRGWDFEPEVALVSDRYPSATTIDAEATVTEFVALGRKAVAEGHTGLRVAADVTSLVRTPEQFEAYARYEHLIDTAMRDNPLTGLCGVDRGVVDDEVTGELAFLHPGTDAPFRLHGAPPAEASAAVGGEIDAVTRDRFTQALGRLDLRPVDGEIVVDGSELTFIDHNTLRDLDAWAGRRGIDTVLRTPFTAARRIAALLELESLRVETTP